MELHESEQEQTWCSKSPKCFAFVQFMLEIDIMEPDFIILENTARWYYM